MYKLLKNVLTNQVDVVQKEEGGFLFSIPMNPANTDYQAYLKWVAEGNTVLPADENNNG